MSGEHPTPIGTPVVRAPGRILLVGEYGDIVDSPAVVAAIGCHAKAQFVPRLDVMPKRVAETVRRTQLELGEIFGALPAGSVQIDDEDFRHPGLLADLGATAAASVATVGALLETVGLPVATRRSLVLAIADGGRRASGGQVGSGADSLAATYGGLVQITRSKGAAPKAFPIMAPKGLHLVVFAASPCISPQQIAGGVQRYEQTDPVGFEDRARALRGFAQRFVDEVNAGQSTGAIFAAGKYGDELAKLGAAAQVPVASEAFAAAAELAREIGGVAKPTGAGNGAIGVAMFATREAAELFRKAHPECISVLEGDFDRLGVRRQGPDAWFESAEIPALPTPLPEVNPDERSAADETAAVERAADEVDTARTTEMSAADGVDAAPTTVVSAADEVDAAPTTVMSAPPDMLATTSRSRRLRVGSVVTVAAAAALVALFTVPKHLGDELERAEPQMERAVPARAPSPPPPTTPAPASAAAAAEVAAPAALPALPPPASVTHPAPPPPPATLTKQHRHEQPVRAATARARKRASSVGSAAPHGAKPWSGPRAGKLTPEDF